MSEEDLTRRKVLSGMAIAGTTGALAGHSTISLFSDEETFTNNSIRASEAAGGTVDLVMETIEDDTRIKKDDDRVGLEVTLPETGKNNPAFICVEAKKCPEDNLEVADDLRVQLELKCPDDDNLGPILTGSLREVLDVLERGVLLCSEDGSCLEPGQTLTLTLEVIEEFTTGDYDIDIELNFFAEQCRYNDIPAGSTLLENPCEGEGECPPPEEGPGISFIAFCSIDGTVSASSVTILGSLQPDDGQPTSLVWTSENPVDYVVVFGGNTWTIYDYSDDGGQAGVTTGVATTAISPFDNPSEDNETDPDVDGDVDGTAADLYYDKNDDFYDSNGDYQNFDGCNENASKSDPRNGAQECPCEVASRQLYNRSFNGTSVKLEWCDDIEEFREECPK